MIVYENPGSYKPLWNKAIKVHKMGELINLGFYRKD
jgi:hypothetical protein